MLETILFFVLLLLPAYVLYDTYKQTFYSPWHRIFTLAMTGLILLLTFFIGRWDLTIYAMRYVFLAAFITIAILAFRKPLDTSKKVSAFTTPSLGVFTVLLLVATGILFRATLPAGLPNAVAIQSPLQPGVNIVGQGGNLVVLNYHYNNKAQKYATDIVGFQQFPNPFKDRSKLANYALYDNPVYAPCSGTIKSTETTHKDLAPPHTDRSNPAGNHVVLQCKGVNILLAHMKQGSIRVKPSQTVHSGQHIGQVGNSGNTTEPHLHIHAVKAGQDVLKGEGVPLRINGRYLVRNDIF